MRVAASDRWLQPRFVVGLAQGAGRGTALNPSPDRFPCGHADSNRDADGDTESDEHADIN